MVLDKLKDYFKYVNQWNVCLYIMTLIQIWSSYVQGDLGLHTLWSIGLVWGIFLVGYNSLDRELEIDLDKARDAIARGE